MLNEKTDVFVGYFKSQEEIDKYMNRVKNDAIFLKSEETIDGIALWIRLNEPLDEPFERTCCTCDHCFCILGDLCCDAHREGPNNEYVTILEDTNWAPDCKEYKADII